MPEQDFPILAITSRAMPIISSIPAHPSYLSKEMSAMTYFNKNELISYNVLKMFV